MFLHAGLGGGAIAGIVVAAVFGVLCFVISAIICCLYANGFFTKAGQGAGAVAGVPPGYQGYPLGFFGQPAELAGFGGNDIYNGGLGNGFGLPNQQLGVSTTI